MKQTTKVLLSAVLTIALCVSVISGATFALFTSTAETNIAVTAGKVNVVATIGDMTTYSMGNPTTTNLTFANGGTASFTDDAHTSIKLDRMTPGDKVEFPITIKNNSNVDIMYRLTCVVKGELAGGLVATAEDVALANGTTQWNKWTTPDADTTNDDDVKTLDVSIELPTNAGNEYQSKSAEISFIVEAVQGNGVPHLDDSQFDTTQFVDTPAGLQAALNNGGNIVLNNDITLTEALTIPASNTTTLSTTDVVGEGAATVLNLNGKKIVGTVGRDDDDNRIHTIINYGNVVIKNGTVASEGVNGGSAIYNAAGANLVVEKDVTILGAPIAEGAWPSYGINNYGMLTVNGTTIKTYHGGIATGGDGVTVINDAIIDVGQGTTTKQTSWALYAFENGELTVYDGLFENTKQENNKVYGGGYLCPISTKPCVIYGGTFNKTEGDNNGTGIYYQPTNLVINGGVFDTDPSAYVAKDYKAFETPNGYVVMSESIEGTIYTADQLASAGENGGEYVLVGNITMADAANVAVKNDLVLDLNGYTVTGKDTTSANFGLLNIDPGKKLTINDSVGTGALALSATINSGWNRYSAVISNQRGTLIVNGGTIQHLGGTDMSYAIDNLTNTGEEEAKTVINGGHIESSYIGIRQFCNSAKGLNVLEINDGTIVGVRRSVWMQQPNDNQNLAQLTINNGTLDGVIGIGADFFDVTVNGGNFTDLQTAVNYASNNAIIGLADDFVGDITVTQKADVKITIDGLNHEFNGILTVFGNGRKATAGLTVKNINFVAKTGAASCIVSPDRTVNNAYSYSSNVTVEGCTFTDPDGTVDCAAVRHEDGGDSNWKIIDCVVDNTMHSLIQTNNVELDGLTIQGCEVYSKNGINLNQCAKVDIIDCTIDVKGYAVRYGVNGATVNGTFLIKDSTLKSANDDGDAVIIFRGTMTGSTLTLDNTTLVGDPQTTGNANVVTK